MKSEYEILFENKLALHSPRNELFAPRDGLGFYGSTVGTFNPVNQKDYSDVTNDMGTPVYMDLKTNNEIKKSLNESIGRAMSKYSRTNRMVNLIEHMMLGSSAPIASIASDISNTPNKILLKDKPITRTKFKTLNENSNKFSKYPIVAP